MEEYTRESLIEKARELALSHDGPLTRDDFTKSTGISEYFIKKEFPDGGWRELVRLAGIKPHPQSPGRYTNEYVLTEFHKVVQKVNKIPTLVQFDAYSDISSSCIISKFGGIHGIKPAYIDWLRENDPESPYLELLETKSKHEITDVPREPIINGVTSSQQWTKKTGIVYGAPIHFRGLRHAPVNEQGVVYLFGMVAHELGLLVESVQSAFPDCEAKQCIDSKRNLWQRVRIEFEYMSSNFKMHGHNPQECDLIICWEHDWPDCPLEVMELRSVIDKLEA